jgi:hypothetical protein
MFKSLKVDWKDLALGFFIGVTLCLYTYVSKNLDSQEIQPNSRITGFTASE